MVQAKFRVYEIAKRAGYNGEDPVVIKMAPVQGGPFGKYTPSGSIEMTILNKAASDQFELGKEYFVEFRPADTTPVV